MNELALFAGAGGGILASRLLGWRTRCAVEFDAYARKVLLARQRDGQLERFPIWTDVRTFDGLPWRGAIDVITGGFPCQDISSANNRAKGINGSKSSLWREMARIIGEVRPKFALIENSNLLVSRGLEQVLEDLFSLGYNASWGVLAARNAGAPHLRKRIWIVANLNEERCEELRRPIIEEEKHSTTKRDLLWPPEPRVVRVVHGMANRVVRVGCLGNGQVPRVAQMAWEELIDNLKKWKINEKDTGIVERGN